MSRNHILGTLNLLKIVLTMGISTASAERLFSSLRRLKTYLRSNNVGQLSFRACTDLHRKRCIPQTVGLLGQSTR